MLAYNVISKIIYVSYIAHIRISGSHPTSFYEKKNI